MSRGSALLAECVPHSRARLSIGPIELDALPRESLIGMILENAFHATATHLVATINAQFYVLAEQDVVFHDCLKRAELVCADGVSIELAASILTGQRVERLAGVDLLEEICRRGALKGLRVFLLGGRPGSAVSLALLLQGRYAGLEIAGTSCPPLGFEKNEQQLRNVLDTIREARPHVVFVALGAPKQELFVDQYLRNLAIPVAVGVGGSFEILTKITRRAPRVIQRLGFEWFYRLCQEPRRLWRRYLLGNPHFLWILTRQWVLARRT